MMATMRPASALDHPMVTQLHHDRLEELARDALACRDFRGVPSWTNQFDGGAVSVRLYRDAGFAVIEVTDTGVGMSPEFVRERLFKPFQTTKKAGMGIGVYESMQYVGGLGGQILIDSKVRAAVESVAAIESVGKLVLKGFNRPVKAFSVRGLQ